MVRSVSMHRFRLSHGSRNITAEIVTHHKNVIVATFGDGCPRPFTLVSDFLDPTNATLSGRSGQLA